MDDSLRMRGGKRIGHLDSDGESAAEIERPAIDQLAYIAALDVLHGDEVNAADFVQVENGANVGMIQRGSQLGFSLKAFEVGLFDGQLGRQDFDDHGPAQFGIDGFVNSSLAAFANLFQDLVTTERSADHEATI